MKGWIITLLLIIGLPGAIAGSIFVPMALRAWTMQRVLDTGLPASAEVVELQDTGNVINNRPVYRIILKITPPGEPSFSATVQRTLTGTNLFAFAPGSTLHVKYNPRDHTQVAIVYGSD